MLSKVNLDGIDKNKKLRFVVKVLIIVVNETFGVILFLLLLLLLFWVVWSTFQH